MKNKPSSTKDFDFKLLTIFNEIYNYSSVTLAAKALNCSPSFVSQSLQKLRVFFSDPLFVRNGQKLTPTTLAKSIYSNLSMQYTGMLDTLESLSKSANKDLLVVHCASYFAIRIIPWIVEWTEEHAPNCKVVHRDFLRDQYSLEDLLLLRDVDLVFDVQPVYTNALYTVALLEEDLTVFCRKNHPRLGSEISIDETALEKFSVLSSNGLNIQLVQTQLEHQVNNRIQKYQSSCILSIPAVVACSNIVGIIPTWLFSQSELIYPIRSLKAEFSLPPIPFYMMYSKPSLRNIMFSNLVSWLEDKFTTNSRLPDAD